MQITGKATSQKTSNNQTNKSMGLIIRKFLYSSKGKIVGRHWLTFSGITLGVFALLSVSSVMNGFDKDMRQRIIGTRSEIRLDNKNGNPLSAYDEIGSKLEARSDIHAVSPVVRNELMLMNGSSMGASVCFGIDFARQSKISPILHPLSAKELAGPANHWLQGLLSGQIDSKAFEANGIILGVELAQSIKAAVGDTITLVSPVGSIPTPLGLLPKSLPLRVEGIFIAGMPEYDRLYSYVPLSVGQFFSGYPDEVDHLDIRTTQPGRLFRLTKNLQKAFPDYRIENWSSFDSSLYGAMHFEKYLMLVILGLMFIIASFNMTGNIFKTIIQKRRSLGILKTLGYSDDELVSLLLRQGLLISVAGILTGVVLAILLLSVQTAFGIIRLPVGNMPKLILPVDMRLFDFVIIPVIALLVSWLSILIPARKARSVNPIDLIREIV
jgi:lipoprotein-releasing system permease protein